MKYKDITLTEITGRQITISSDEGQALTLLNDIFKEEFRAMAELQLFSKFLDNKSKTEETVLRIVAGSEDTVV